MKYKVIEVRNMHTAIHELFIVNAKPKTTLKLFERLEDCEDEWEAQELWNEIGLTTEHFGEVNFREKLENKKYGEHYDFGNGNIYEVINYPKIDIWLM